MKLSILLIAVCVVAGEAQTQGDPGSAIPRCQIVPLPGEQVSFRIDGEEKTRWHFGPEAPRPFFFPFRGPSGAALTRMGHPGAPNHDHHRSIWFAHNQVNGLDFWGDKTDPTEQATILQTQWYAYHDGNEEAIMASALVWLDHEGNPVLHQDLAAALIPLRDGEFLLELQLTFTPAVENAEVELGMTNFGFLAVRVAKSISVHFGGGTITNDKNVKGEKLIFGNASRWMDYSGPVAVGKGASRKISDNEGITCFDHPENSRPDSTNPVSWHVRDDGWMGPSACRDKPRTVTTEKPLVLRYLLYSHSGSYDADRAQAIHQDFLARPGFVIKKSRVPHHQFEVQRSSNP